MKDKLDQALTQLDGIVVGKSHVLRLALCCLLARGHLLIEDIPGVGKTTLARALSKSLGLDLRRIQFTSDLLPGDILGNSIFDRDTQKFVFHPGPIFSQIILADEINRATPKTQSALLEAMEEEQVSVDGQTHPLPNPFFVIATQNPHHLIGTYPLPESQLDRFLMRLELGFPDRDAEREMLSGPDRRHLIQEMAAFFSPQELSELQKAASKTYVSQPILDYLLDILAQTRRNPREGSGLSPRAGLALQRAAQAWAFMAGRDMVIPEDIQAVGKSVMAHRLGASWDGSSPSGNIIADQILKSVPVKG
jgi:MoxR-like ATPase